MNKFKYNSEQLKNAKKFLDQSVSDFNSAISIAESLNTLNFSYSNWLDNLPNLIRKCKTDITNVNEWITTSMKLVNNFCDESVNKIDGLEVRSNFIKSVQINKI